MSRWDGQPTDGRRARRREERRLVFAVAGVLLLGGSVAIGLVYGWRAVLTGLLCLLPGALALILIFLLLRLLDRVMERWD